MDSLLELFCDVDDFCQSFLPKWKEQLFSNGEIQELRKRSLSLSEVTPSLASGAGVTILSISINRITAISRPPTGTMCWRDCSVSFRAWLETHHS
jgi:hypothetical protein